MTRARVRIGDRWVGEGEPVFVIAEVGLNHNGSLELARKLIDGAVLGGADAVKFQKRTPELCVPPEQWNLERETPWGRLKYIDYRRRVELGAEQFAAIDRHCRDRGITWFASCWDEPSVDFIAHFDAPCYKVASACLTDHDLLRRKRATGRPIILSTGMSTMAEIEGAVEALGASDLLIAHATSTYPCPVGDLNLRMMETLRQRFPACPIGYSGHETGLAPTWAAVALGATFVERHITLDRAMWGSDQSASVEVGGFMRLVSQIRDVERALGDGIKRIYAGELPQLEKLRRVRTAVRAAS
jgi:N-acetylneuraminate synthase